MEPVIIVLFAALVICAIVFSIYASAKRKKELQLWAQARGLRFDPSKDRGMDERFDDFKCLRQGSNRYAYNRISGLWKEQEFLAFDYHYETHSTDSKGRRQTHHHSFSAVVLGAPMRLKPLLIRPEGFFDKITEFFGLDDIDFESAEFSRKFYVKSSDKRWAYDVIHQRTMEFLLQQPKFTIQFDESHVIASDGSVFSTDDLTTASTVARGVIDLFPDYLVRQQTIGA